MTLSSVSRLSAISNPVSSMLLMRDVATTDLSPLGSSSHDLDCRRDKRLLPVFTMAWNNKQDIFIDCKVGL